MDPDHRQHVGGELADAAVSVRIASLTGVFPWSLFATPLLTNDLFKVGVEAVTTSVTYRIVGTLKCLAQEDVRR